MNKTLREMSYEDYGISKNRLRELKYFCLQYEEKKQEIRYNGPRSAGYNGMPQTQNTGDPTQTEAIRNVMNRRHCELIEQAAIRANAMLYPYILLSVTTKTAYEHLGMVPVCKKDFYGYRRLFFHYLDEKDKIL